uniref:Cadherin-related family member 5b n=1 Tax=Stegastes partitus TaxID=144197 RepID=A0A3B5A230_9TELE
CSAPSSLVNFPENNNVGDVVATITVQSGVTLEFSPPPENPENPFRLEGNQLVAERMLDFENDFVLRSSTNPEILVNARLDYDKVKNVELILTAKDAALVAGDEVHTATTTIIVTIVDVDNRPPWFQPCTEVEVDGNVICHSAGYTGSVTLNEQETGVLPLKPGPLHAIDGDTGINEKITYSFLSNEDNLFEINQNTGGITMLKPTDVLGTISLSVLQVSAIDTTNDESDTSQLLVEVKSMAVLGAVLGVLLFVCLVVIGMLVCRLQKGKADWKKIYEASMFRSSLGQGSGGHKEGIQYTNEAFQNDEDGSSLGSGSPDGGSVKYAKELPQTTWSIPREEAIVRSTAPLHDLLPDDSSDTASEGADSEKDVKPILTKERRVEEGYKSVWFKEDIDPNAKEEVVIIPDSREDDSEEEDEEPSRSNREDDE